MNGLLYFHNTRPGAIDIGCSNITNLCMSTISIYNEWAHLIECAHSIYCKVCLNLAWHGTNEKYSWQINTVQNVANVTSGRLLSSITQPVSHKQLSIVRVSISSLMGDLKDLQPLLMVIEEYHDFSSTLLLPGYNSVLGF